MHRATSRLASIVVALVVIGASCSSDDESSGNAASYEALRPTTTDEPAEGSCPVDLDAAVSAHVEDAEDAMGRAEAVEAEPPSTQLDPASSSPIDVPPRAEAAFVTCSVAVGDDVATIDLLLYMATDGSAPNWLLAQLANDAGIESDALTEIVDQFADADPGTILTMPAGVDNVSMAITEVDGAESAAFLLSGTGSIDSTQLDEVATSLDEVLH